MARSLTELHDLLAGLDGVEAVYIQAPTAMKYPCVLVERSSSDPTFADNKKYVLYKGYTLIVVDRAPDSLIPDLVEGLPHTRFDRAYRANGLYHTAFNIFF